MFVCCGFPVFGVGTPKIIPKIDWLDCLIYLPEQLSESQPEKGWDSIRWRAPKWWMGLGKPVDSMIRIWPFLVSTVCYLSWVYSLKKIVEPTHFFHQKTASPKPNHGSNSMRSGRCRYSSGKSRVFSVRLRQTTVSSDICFTRLWRCRFAILETKKN